MNIDNIKEFIVPVVLLLFYFFVSAAKKGKKKPSHSSRKEEDVRASIPKEPPRFANQSLKPSSRPTPIVSDQIVSAQMQKYSQSDSVIPSIKRNPSRAKKLFRQTGSARKAMLLKEILDAYYP